MVQDLGTRSIQSCPCKNTKLHRKRRRACKRSWSRRGNQKSFTLTISQNLANPVKPFPGIIVRQHRTYRKLMGLVREQSAESRKGNLRYCCNQVRTKNGGRIPWNVTAICETFKISCLIRRHPITGGSENHSMAPVIPFGAMVEYHPISDKDLSRLHQFMSKSLARHIPWTCVACGGNLERRRLGRRH